MESRSSRISPRCRTWSPQRADELFPQGVVQAHQIADGRRVLPAAEGGLGAERVAQFLISDDLQQRIVTQTIGVVGIFVAGHDLINTLPQQCHANHGAGGRVAADR